jgi:hypothetical protein
MSLTIELIQYRSKAHSRASQLYSDSAQSDPSLNLWLFARRESALMKLPLAVALLAVTLAEGFRCFWIFILHGASL